MIQDNYFPFQQKLELVIFRNQYRMSLMMPWWCYDDNHLFCKERFLNYLQCPLLFCLCMQYIKLPWYNYTNSIALDSLAIIDFITESRFGHYLGNMWPNAFRVARRFLFHAFVLILLFWYGNIFRVNGHLSGEFTGPRWIPRTKASDAELWCFLWHTPE